MPCKGCGTSSPGKTRCCVCYAKWCNACLYEGAEKRDSGWKCNECVGTASSSLASGQQLTNTGHPDHYIHQQIKNRGYYINDSNKDDVHFRQLVEQFKN